MKTEAHAGAVRALGFLSVTARLFVLLAVEYTAAKNASWFSAILGFILALPVLFLMKSVSERDLDTSPEELLTGRKGTGVFKAASCILCPLLILNAARSAQYVFLSANYAALTEVGRWTLMIPLFLVFLLALTKGGRGIAGSAALTLAAVPWLIGIVVIAQIQHYEPRWLTPILGGGIRHIITGGIHAAGAYMELFALWLISVPDIKRSGRALSPFSLGIFACITASFLLVLYSMMSPAKMNSADGALLQLNTVLYNGRASLALHLPIMTAWLLCLLHRIAFGVFTASALLVRILPKVKESIIWTLVILATAALALTVGSAMPRFFAKISALWYPIAGICAGILFAKAMPKEGERA